MSASIHPRMLILTNYNYESASAMVNVRQLGVVSSVSASIIIMIFVH